MEHGFRSSMNLLHTWAGVVVGALLFAIFWMGTLSVYDREIDRWMAPMTRLELPAKPTSFDALRGTYDAAVAARARSWTMLQPSERQPVVRIVYRDGPELLSLYFDPVSGAALPEPGTWAGTRFFHPFHYRLHLKAWDIGEWLVGIAAMTMLLLCVSGVVIHRKMIAEFFTLRAWQKSARMVLDMHTVAGVLGLPFNFIIALSGLIILSVAFFPSGWQASYPDRQSFNAEAYGAYTRPKANKPGTLVSLDRLAQEAKRMWGGAEPWAIVVQHPGDAKAFVSIFQSFDHGIVRSAPAIHFDAATGAVLHQSGEMRPLAKAQRFISGMHQIQFRHWMLRALYFALGLFGCLLVLTGFLFWLQSRRRRHAAEGMSGVRIVEAIAVGSTAGIIAASVSFMVINRILPLGVSFLGIERYALEIWVFYLVWLATFAHAWWRPRGAWAEQCRVIATLAVFAIVLNWVTTGHHLLRSLSIPHLWPVAGVDIGLLALASSAFGISRCCCAPNGRPGRRPPITVARAAMRDALYLFVAFAATYLAFACFALAQRRHWRAVMGATDCPRLGRRLLKITGVVGLAAGLAVVLWREGADYGTLLWVTQLTAGASCVVATLSLRPRLLKLLAAIPARA